MHCMIKPNRKVASHYPVWISKFWLHDPSRMSAVADDSSAWYLIGCQWFLGQAEHLDGEHAMSALFFPRFRQARSVAAQTPVRSE